LEKGEYKGEIEMKKIGLLCLALVLALGTLGVGYAMWSDEVIIEGTVDTATLRLGIIKAEADLYQDKDVATVELSFEGAIAPWECEVPPGAEDFAYEKLVVTLNNTFPCLTVDIAFYVGSAGSIPIHITGFTMTDPTGELTVVWTGLHTGYFYRTGGDPVEDRVITFTIINLICSQLHECQPDKADLILHVEQPAEQNHQYKFEFKVIGEQWAECPEINNAIAQ
jgi:hypothetical protein